MATLAALALAGCNTTGSQSSAALGGMRGATVAFDSIDGAPRDVFDRLVQELNTEAHSRNLAVVSRADQSAYRVRGYLLAERADKQNSINWIWDVYDDRRQRVLRITGQQTVNGKHPDAWQALDGPALHKIAQDSISQLATFLTSPDAVPAARAQVALGDGSSPEAAGIFRIVPVSATPTEDIAPEETPADVPLPPHRPGLTHTAALTVAAAGQE
ncbi:MAG TPA: hypothetical protein VHD59_00700 [Pseudolabrys sp.]|nr:hypothetical protein [Pseudolabrys sp.]